MSKAADHLPAHGIGSASTTTTTTTAVKPTSSPSSGGGCCAMPSPVPFPAKIARAASVLVILTHVLLLAVFVWVDLHLWTTKYFHWGVCILAIAAGGILVSCYSPLVYAAGAVINIFVIFVDVGSLVVWWRRSVSDTALEICILQIALWVLAIISLAVVSICGCASAITMGEETGGKGAQQQVLYQTERTCRDSPQASATQHAESGNFSFQDEAQELRASPADSHGRLSSSPPSPQYDFFVTETAKHVPTAQVAQHKYADEVIKGVPTDTSTSAHQSLRPLPSYDSFRL